MKLTTLIVSLSFLLAANSARANNSEKIAVGQFEGNVLTNENIRIKALKAEAVLSFCWGFCGDGVGGGKAKEIQLDTQDWQNNTFNFRSLKTLKFRASDMLGRFKYCAVRLTVLAEGELGRPISVHGNLASSSDKKACAEGKITPPRKRIEIMSYPLGGNLKIYYLAH